MENDYTLHVKICPLGAVIFIAVDPRNGTPYIKHICYNTKHITKD